ncbi:MAG: methyl-coenzyme M reductase I operon protein C [Candidatus Methanomethylicia archaeon]|nr:methyl-coenzyme M reductase I operon protein C [Candidatus Methanomethylicia archaeon]MCQ5374689.1 methyl-coenzyme M reductase I operon protein C [Candidatus Methanomethylicia archaeon]
MDEAIGRSSQIVDCREAQGIGEGGGLAQRGTISESERFDVVAVAMSPSKRHITKPICEITYGLREQGIRTSVLVLESGSGVPSDSPYGGAPGGTMAGINEKEILQIRRYKLALFHLGGIGGHVVYKAKTFLRYVDIPTIIVCEAPVDYEDFAKVGIVTRLVRPPPDKVECLGTIVDIVTGVVRGVSAPRDKLNEIVIKVKFWLSKFEGEGTGRVK